MSIFQLAPYYQTENYESASAFEQAVHEKNIEVLLYGNGDQAPVVVSGDLAGTSFPKALQIMPRSALGTKAKFDLHFPLLVWMSTGTHPESCVESGPLKGQTMLFVDQTEGADTITVTKASLPDDGQLKITESGSQTVYDIKKDSILNLQAQESFTFNNGMKVVGIEYLLSGTAEKLAKLAEGKRYNENLQYVKDGQAQVSDLGDNNYFHASLYQLNGSMNMKCDDASFRILVCLDGSAVIQEDKDVLHAKPGNLFFAQAGTDTFSITGNCRFIEIHLH